MLTPLPISGFSSCIKISPRLFGIANYITCKSFEHKLCNPNNPKSSRYFLHLTKRQFFNLCFHDL